MRRQLTAATAALLLAPPLFWAGNAVVARALVGEFPPLALSFARWALALLLILPFAIGGLREAWPRLRGQWPLLMGISALGVGCYNSLQYLALQTSTAVNATLIGASGPIMTLLVGAAFFGSPVRRLQWIGAALSMVGVLIVIARGDLMKLATLQLDRGDIIMLVATLTWSVYTWLLRTRRPNLPATPFLTLQMALGALMILPFAVLEFLWTGQAVAPTDQQPWRADLCRLAALTCRLFLLGPGSGPCRSGAADVLRESDTGVCRPAVLLLSGRGDRAASPDRGSADHRGDPSRKPTRAASVANRHAAAARYNPRPVPGTVATRSILPEPDA